MRIVCPSCSAAYDVPDGLLRGRRTVRCASCAREWNLTEVPPEAPDSLFRPEPPPMAERSEVMEAEPDASLEPEPPRREGIPRETIARVIAMNRLAQPPPPRGRGAVAVGWLLSVGLLVALAWLAYDWRIEVMNAWPPSVRLYGLLGLA